MKDGFAMGCNMSIDKKSNLGGARLSKAFMVLAALAVIVQIAATPAANLARTYAIPNHGQLELIVPKAWKASVNQPPDDLPFTITFSPAQGGGFKFLVTPIWSEPAEPSFNSPQKIRALLEAKAQKLLATSVEARVAFEKLTGAGTSGYFYSLTDRSPNPANPNDYKYVTQGAIGLGDLMILFTFLSHDRDSLQRKAALEIVKNAAQKAN